MNDLTSACIGNAAVSLDNSLPGPSRDGLRLPSEDLLRFNRDGFLVIRNVFSPEEVANLRGAVERFASEAKAKGRVLRPTAGELGPMGDLLGREGLDWLVSDARVAGIARQLIGRQSLVYFGDGGVMVGGSGRGFHKDNTCRDLADHEDWRSPYTLIRMGIYLEDHEHHSGGLKVRRGSHRHPDVTTGQIVDIPTRAGDVVAWFLTTTHSGHAVRVSGLPFVHLQPRFEFRMPAPLQVPEEKLRLAAFLTFGTDDHHLRTYIAKHTNLETYPDNYMYKSWLFSYGGDDAARRLAAAGITFLKPVAEYGSLFDPEHTLPEGFVATKPGRPDVYPPKGMEAAIQTIGSVLRRVGLAL